MQQVDLTTTATAAEDSTIIPTTTTTTKTTTTEVEVEDNPGTTTDLPLKKGTLKCKSQDCHRNDVIYKAHGPLTGYCVRTDRWKCKRGEI